MNLSFPVKVDDVGRVVIPKKIRDIYSISDDSYLYLLEKGNSLYFSLAFDKTNFLNHLSLVHNYYPFLNFKVFYDDNIIYETSFSSFNYTSALSFSFYDYSITFQINNKNEEKLAFAIVEFLK